MLLNIEDQFISPSQYWFSLNEGNIKTSNCYSGTWLSQRAVLLFLCLPFLAQNFRTASFICTFVYVVDLILYNTRHSQRKEIAREIIRQVQNRKQYDRGRSTQWEKAKEWERWTKFSIIKFHDERTWCTFISRQFMRIVCTEAAHIHKDTNRLFACCALSVCVCLISLAN